MKNDYLVDLCGDENDNKYLPLDYFYNLLEETGYKDFDLVISKEKCYQCHFGLTINWTKEYRHFKKRHKYL